MDLIPNSAGLVTKPITVWTPATLGSLLLCWWNADDHGTANMTDDGSGLISAWKDRKNAVSSAATTTARPTWTSNAFNSAYAGLTFDGAANAMTIATVGAIPTAANPSFIFVMAHWGSAVSVRAFVVGNNSTGSDRRVGVPATSFLLAGDGTTNLTDNDATAVPGNTMAEAYFDGTTLFGFRNGTAFAPTASSALIPNTSSTRARIGASAATSAGAFFNGVIRHIIIFSTLTVAQRQQVEGWLAWNSGLASILPSDHPFKNWPP